MVPEYYDVHCHFFSKNVLVRQVINVIQALMHLRAHLKQRKLRGKFNSGLESLVKYMEVQFHNSPEESYLQLDQTYQQKLILIPLMFDFTYADDNLTNLRQNKKYLKRIIRILRLVSFVMLPYIRLKLGSGKYSRELRISARTLKDSIGSLIDELKLSLRKDVEIFDDSNLDQQIAELEFLHDNYSNVKPFISIDPRQEYMGNLHILPYLEEKLLGENAGFSGIKLYTPAGYSPTDPLLMGLDGQGGLYQFCQKHGIPITVHCSNGGFASFARRLKVRGHIYNGGKIRKVNEVIHFRANFFGWHMTEAIQERATTLNHPKLWKHVLENYPNLHINFAHFGGSTHMNEFVHYILPESLDLKKLKATEKRLPLDVRIVISQIYRKRNGRLQLSEQLTQLERKPIWLSLYAAGLIDNWTKAIFDLISDPGYPNAYSDLSCFTDGQIILDPEDERIKFSIKEALQDFKSSFYNECSEYEKSRFIFGSDYYFTRLFGPDPHDYLISFREVFGSDFTLLAKSSPEKFLFGSTTAPIETAIHKHKNQFAT